MTGTTEQHAATHTRIYAWIWIYLICLTCVELVLAYQHVFSPGTMMLVLMLLSVVKAGMIMTWFMHLGSERTTLVLTLLPPLILVLALLFGFFPDAFRLFELGVRH
jgi:caa(3)-type oxidase subunit IV